MTHFFLFQDFLYFPDLKAALKAEQGYDEDAGGPYYMM